MTWNVYTLVATCLCAGAIYAFMVSFSRSVRALIRFVFRMLLGVGGIAAFNGIAAVYSLYVGINLYTCLTCGLFGLPGCILLVGTRLLF